MTTSVSTVHCRATHVVIAAVVALLLLGCRNAPHECEASGNITIAIPAMPTSLDWNRSHESSWSNYPVMLAAMRGLTALDEHSNPVPALAERWDIEMTSDVPPKQIITFHLRKDIVWSDGRTPLVANDFVIGWRRAILGNQPVELSDIVGADAILALRARKDIDPQERAQALAAAVERLGVEAVDEHTLRVTLVSERNYFLARVATAYQMFPLPSGLASKSAAEIENYFNEPRDDAPLVVGPYRIVSWDRVAKSVRLARNPHWRGAPPSADTLTLVQADLASVLYERCKVDFMLVDDPVALAHAGPDLQRTPLMSVYWLGLNASRVPLKLRLAIAHAIDRTKIGSGLLPRVRPAFGLLPHDVLPGAATPSDPEAKDLVPRYDPERARTLVNESGYKGEELVLLVRSSDTFLPETGIAEQVKNQLAEVGIKVRIQTTSQFSRDVKNDDGSVRVDLFLRRTGADYAHPQTFFTVFDPNGNHYTEWHRGDAALRDRFRDLLARGAAASSLDAIKSAYTEAQRFLLSERAVAVPLFYPDRYYRRRPWLQDARIDPFNFIVLR